MDQLRPLKASFYGVNVSSFPLGCFVYSFPEPAPSAASSHLKYTVLSPCQGITASQTDKQACILPRSLGSYSGGLHRSGWVVV